ncbi:MAG: helix-turn-helix transcriptional regulator [Burkholderiales bacterium]|nr:helix-turn-helix transcriptional regulator [Burkholderiales bacterium]
MLLLQELGTAVKTRRSDMGLTQAALARISGLSRSTVNSLENGSIRDLSVNRAHKLLEAIGLSLSIPEVRPRIKQSAVARSAALEVAARTANVSYKTQATGEHIRTALLKAEVPSAAFANVRALLEEAPVSMLARVVEQIHAESKTSRADVWKNMRAVAQRMHVQRDIFQ